MREDGRIVDAARRFMMASEKLKPALVDTKCGREALTRHGIPFGPGS